MTNELLRKYATDFEAETGRPPADLSELADYIDRTRDPASALLQHTVTAIRNAIKEQPASAEEWLQAALAGAEDHPEDLAQWAALSKQGQSSH